MSSWGSANGTGALVAPPDTTTRWLPVPTVAIRKNVSEEAVRKACRTGRLTARKNNDQWYVEPGAVAAWNPRGHTPAGMTPLAIGFDLLDDITTPTTTDTAGATNPAPATGDDSGDNWWDRPAHTPLDITDITPPTYPVHPVADTTTPPRPVPEHQLSPPARATRSPAAHATVRPATTPAPPTQITTDIDAAITAALLHADNARLKRMLHAAIAP